jgi:hypothetical protein
MDIINTEQDESDRGLKIRNKLFPEEFQLTLYARYL